MCWQGILYGRIYVDFSFLVVHKVCTKARLLGERSVRIREVKGSNPSRSTFSNSVILTLLLFFCIHIVTRRLCDPEGFEQHGPAAGRASCQPGSQNYKQEKRSRPYFLFHCRVSYSLSSDPEIASALSYETNALRPA